MSASPSFIVGNWKMNGTGPALAEAQGVSEGLAGISARVGLCPPATLIQRMAETLSGSRVEIGGQDCRPEASGAFTGDISAEMIAEAGGGLVILGHSERRSGYGETDDLVARKVLAALSAGLEPIICVGETLDQRRSGEALKVVVAQVIGSLPSEIAKKAYAVAYEPVWAIGTGLTPSLPEIEEVHGAIRAALVELFGADGAKPPILYGGSVKPDNAKEILSAHEVGGALVGGASLKAVDFLKIIQAA